MNATRDLITREAGFAMLLLRAVLRRALPAHIAAVGNALVGSSVLPTHFEPMGFGVISKTFNHFNIANVTST
jgi:hypothetical protein